MEEIERRWEKPAVKSTKKPAQESRKPVPSDAAPVRKKPRPATSDQQTKPYSPTIYRPTAVTKEQSARTNVSHEKPKPQSTMQRQPSEAPKKPITRTSEQQQKPKPQSAPQRQPSESPKKQVKRTEETQEQPKKRKSDLFYSAFGLLVKVGWIALSIFLILQFIVGVHKNHGVNMEPSLHDRDLVFYNRLKNSYEAGDVVVFKQQNGTLQVGRIVARSGDTVEIDEGSLKLNGYFQTEPYSKGETVQFEGTVTFPLRMGRDEYFILFDNRAQGGDSRTMGKISADEIKGHVILTMRARDF